MTRTSAGFRYWIFQRTDVPNRWILEWEERAPGGRLRKRTKRCLTEGAAQAEADRLDNLARAEAGLADDVLLRDYASKWFRRIEPILSRGTTHAYRTAIDFHVLPWRSHAWLRDLRPGEIRDFLSEKLRGGPAKKSVANIRGTLHSLLEEAVADGILAVKLARSTGRTRALKLSPTRAERRQNVKAMTAEQLQAFLAAAAEVCPPPRALQFRLMAMTGLRPGEAAALRWDDLDLVGGTVLVRRSYTHGRIKSTKSGEERTVDLGQATAADLQRRNRKTRAAALATGKARPEYVFPSRVGTPVDHNYVGFDFRRAEGCRPCAPADPPLPPPHLRHSSLGHAAISQTVDRYGSWLPAGNRAHADALEESVAAGPKGGKGARRGRAAR